MGRVFWEEKLEYDTVHPFDILHQLFSDRYPALVSGGDSPEARRDANRLLALGKDDIFDFPSSVGNDDAGFLRVSPVHPKTRWCC